MSVCLITGVVDLDHLVNVVSPLYCKITTFSVLTVNTHVDGVYLRPCEFCQEFLKGLLAPSFTSLLTCLKNSKRLQMTLDKD